MPALSLPNSVMRTAFRRSRSSITTNGKSHCSRWITFGGHPNRSARMTKSASVVTTEKSFAFAHRQISSSPDCFRPTSRTWVRPGKSRFSRGSKRGERFSSRSSFTRDWLCARSPLQIDILPENPLFRGQGVRKGFRLPSCPNPAIQGHPRR